MRSRLLVLLAIAVLAATWTSSARAHPLQSPKRGVVAANQLERLELAVAHNRYVCRHGAGRNKRWHCRALVWSTKELRERKPLRPSIAARAMRWAYSSAGKCVRREEGGLRSVNPAGYYGTWQADLDFQRAYGFATEADRKAGRTFLKRWGTANRWPEWAQHVMGYRGYLARGWEPWPNTARECGLR